MPLRILHTNDMHGTIPKGEQDPRLAKLRGLRETVDVYFDTGDCIKAGNLGIPLSPEPIWPVLAGLDCTASLLGNRETHILSSAFDAKLVGHTHPILCGNMHRRDGSFPLARGLEFEKNGIKVGVISGMVAMVTPAMKTQGISAYLWDPPIASLMAQAEEMRPRVDLLIALTHIGATQDRLLAAQTDKIDIILGGHSHTVIPSPEKVGRTYIAQGGSHSRFAGVYEWEDGILLGNLVTLE